MQNKPELTSCLRDCMEDLFICLSREEGKRLEHALVVESYDKDRIIYSEGDQPDHMFCLLEGKVKIFKRGVGGRNQTVRLVKPVEYFGYRPYLAGQAFISGAATLESSIVAKLPLTHFERLVKSNGEVAWFFISKLAYALGRADERTVNLTQKHINGRLAESIFFLRDKYGVEEDGCTLCARISREDLANMSNMTTSNAIRTLSTFAADKLIETDGRSIKIINERELERISLLG